MRKIRPTPPETVLSTAPPRPLPTLINQAPIHQAHLQNPLTLVAIGAAQASLAVCAALAESLPRHPQMAFVLIGQAYDTATAALTEPLRRRGVALIAAQDALPLEAARFYVAAPERRWSWERGMLRASAAKDAAEVPPFDHFLATLAAAGGNRAVAVLLEGLGPEGQRGAMAVKAAGGFVVMQEPDEATVAARRHSAIATGAVDFVLPVALIAGALEECQRRIDHRRARAPRPARSKAEPLPVRATRADWPRAAGFEPAAADLAHVVRALGASVLLLGRDLRLRAAHVPPAPGFPIGSPGQALGRIASLAFDATLASDAATVAAGGAAIAREVARGGGECYRRLAAPTLGEDGQTSGVVVVYTPISAEKKAIQALEEARQQAELTALAKARFLAMASHDLRQPLQTLALLQGLLLKLVEGDRPRALVRRLDETLGAVAGMLNTMLDINQIDAGQITPEPVRFAIDELLLRLGDAFTYQAQAQGLRFRVVRSGLTVVSDPRLLEQMLRNLLAQAFKDTSEGKILLGCRRHGEAARVEIWDTGTLISAAGLETLFGEFGHDVPPERSRGLSLGLYGAQRLGTLLGHQLDVHARPQGGACFAVSVPLPHGEQTARGPRDRAATESLRTGTLLVVENDRDVRELLQNLLTEEGHRVVGASDAGEALELVARRNLKPDLLLAECHLPGPINGLELAERLREKVHFAMPGIILTGDIATITLRDISQHKCVRLSKPVRLAELSATIQRLLPLAHAAARLAAPRAASPAPERSRRALIFVVDDDAQVRGAIASVLEDEGHQVEDYATSEAFLAAFRPDSEACLLIDAYLPGMSGIQLLQQLREAGHVLPSVMITGNSDVPMAVEAMKAGAADFIEKPIGRLELLAAIERALERARDQSKLTAWRESAASHVADLTPRQREIMQMVLAGHPSKNIAADLGISQRTVENHRASIMKKTGSKSLPALARLALAAAWTVPGDAPG